MHASRHYRAAFEQCVLDGVSAADVGADTPVPLATICNRLNGCGDTMPARLCVELGLPRGSTYNDGVASFADLH